jgi:hypothetical protein
MFKRKPKKLTLRQVHSLYLLLRSCLPEKEERYLIDEIGSMVGRMKSDGTLIRAVEIMYPKRNFDKKNPMELLALFIRGLNQNDFFSYVQFLRNMNGKRTI